jgi:sensor histidine kinase YesM
MQFLKYKIGNWLPHVIGVLFMLLMPMFVFNSSDNNLTFWIYTYYFHMVFMIIIFYVNYLFVTPHFYFTKNKFYYFGGLLLFAILMIIISQLVYRFLDFDQLRESMGLFPTPESNEKPGLIHPRLIDNFFLYMFVIGTSTGASIIKRHHQNEKEQQAREKAHLDTELSFLKNQISPHFFFNALNNIYALIAIDSDKAQQSVEKLSGLMRYLIYESDIRTIELRKEFEFTKNYIELMRQRLTSKVTLEVDIADNVENVNIPPLMFIPFVENAFKHGVSYREKSFIRISLKTVKNKVVFSCENSIPSNNYNGQKKIGGVGITNIKKRLDLIYGNKAKLKMDTYNNTFIVDLVIPFDEDKK